MLSVYSPVVSEGYCTAVDKTQAVGGKVPKAAAAASTREIGGSL